MIIGARAHIVAQAEALAERGFPLMEISVLSAEAFQRDLKRLRSLQETQDIKFLAHGPEEGKAQDSGFLKNEMLPCINRITECLPELGVELLTIHFWLDRRFIEPRIIDQKIKLLRLMAEYAAAQGLQLCVENLSERALDFEQAFGEIESLGMTLDIGHGELLSERNTAYDFLAQYLEKIYHIHVHDNQGGNDQSDDLHLLPGQGIIDFRSILKVAAGQGYNRTMTLEVEPDHAQQGRQYIQKLWDAVNPPERIV